MGAWKYSNFHETYPVKDGDIVCVGRQIFVCGDLTKDTKLDAMLDVVPPDLMYVDPPWNDSLARSFRTKAGVDGEKGKAVSCLDLQISVLNRAKKHRIPVYLEGGVKWTDLSKNAISATGGELLGEWLISYGKMPCKLYCADYSGTLAGKPLPDLEGASEDNSCQIIFDFHKPRTVTDPCHGRGWVARVANYYGIQAVTSELSPYRMADAIGFLVADIEASTGIKPPIHWLR